jgi:hypothetical protein
VIAITTFLCVASTTSRAAISQPRRNRGACDFRIADNRFWLTEKRAECPRALTVRWARRYGRPHSGMILSHYGKTEPALACARSRSGEEVTVLVAVRPDDTAKPAEPAASTG